MKIIIGKSKTAHKVLKRHLIKSHKKPYKCNCCDKSFKIEARYQRHILICQDQNTNGEKKKIPNLCSYCGKSYASKPGLWSHVAIVHDKIPRSEVMNKNPKKVKCEKCDRHFSTQGHYITHYKSHHEETQVKSTKCDFCDTYYKAPDTYNRHIVFENILGEIGRKK